MFYRVVDLCIEVQGGVRDNAAMLRGLLLAYVVSFFAGGLAAARDLNFKTLYAAPEFSWVSDHSANFAFYFERGTEAEREIDEVKSMMEDARLRLEPLLGFETNGAAFGYAMAAIYNEKTTVLGEHELCHVAAVSLWGYPRGAWIDEGLAVYSDDQWWGLPLHSVAKGLLDRGELRPLRDLMQDSDMRMYPDTVTYTEVGSFIKFVYEKYGRDTVKRLWQRGTLKDLARMDQEWRAALASVEAKFPDYPR
jgi:hypothetical protein